MPKIDNYIISKITNITRILIKTNNGPIISFILTSDINQQYFKVNNNTGVIKYKDNTLNVMIMLL